MVDVKSTYQNVPVHPDDRWLMGTAISLSMPPYHLAPVIFTAIADAVEWIAIQVGSYTTSMISS